MLILETNLSYDGLLDDANTHMTERGYKRLCQEVICQDVCIHLVCPRKTNTIPYQILN